MSANCKKKKEKRIERYKHNKSDDGKKQRWENKHCTWNAIFTSSSSCCSGDPCATCSKNYTQKCARMELSATEWNVKRWEKKKTDNRKVNMNKRNVWQMSTLSQKEEKKYLIALIMLKNSSRFLSDMNQIFSG